jgi:hypothetical protein
VLKSEDPIALWVRLLGEFPKQASFTNMHRDMHLAHVWASESHITWDIMLIRSLFIVNLLNSLASRKGMPCHEPDSISMSFAWLN